MSRPAPPVAAVPIEAQSPLYYLRTNRNERQPPHAAPAAAGGHSNSAMTSLDEARLVQLREEHPEYNAFMLDMALYQEQQDAREANRLKRENLEKKKERRLAARLKAVDDLVTLPRLYDANGQPAPLDKKAFGWMKQYHPELANQWDRLLRLSASVVDSTMHRNVVSMGAVEEVAAQQEAECRRRADDHEKRRKDCRDAQVARLEWFRNEYDKRAGKSEEKRQLAQLALEQQSKHFNSHQEETHQRRSVLLHDRTEALKSKMERRVALHDAHMASMRRPTPPLQLSARAEASSEVAEVRRQAIAEAALHANSARRERHDGRMTQLRVEDRDRRQALLTELNGADKKIHDAVADRQAMAAFMASSHRERATKVLERSVEQLAASLQTKEKRRHDADLRDTAASTRREQELLSKQAHTHPTSNGSTQAGTPDSRGNGPSPRYAQPIGRIASPSSRRDRGANESLTPSRRGRSPTEDGGSQAAWLANRRMEDGRYAAGLSLLERKERELALAAKRREEVVEEAVLYPSRQREKHDALVRSRYAEQLQQEAEALEQKLQKEDSKHRAFVPRPPLRYKGPKAPMERVVSEPRTAGPKADHGLAQFVAERAAHCAVVRQRHEAEVSKIRTQAAEAHEQQLHKEAAAQEQHKDVIKSVQYETHSNVTARSDAATKRAHSAERMRLAMKFDASKVLAADSRRDEHLMSESERARATAEARLSAAQRRRDAAAAAREARVLDDVRRRAEKHASMFQVEA